MEHAVKAAEFFIKGYNCAQSVAMAFCDITGDDELTAAKSASSFGGGVGGLREVCGAFCGLTMVVGKLYGYTDPEDLQEKQRVYAIVQDMSAKFKAEVGSTICRDILKSSTAVGLSELEEKYYKIRPCARVVMLASRLLDDYISEHPVK